jgi:hypothetical protein
MTDTPKRIWAVVTEAEIVGPFPPCDDRATEYHRADLSADLVRAALEAAACLAENDWLEYDVADAIREDIKDFPKAIAAIVARVTEAGQ